MLLALSRRTALLTTLLLSSNFARGCEGDCIVAITNALVGNYSIPVARMFESLATSIDAAGILNPQRASGKATVMYLQPLWDQYRKDAHYSMQLGVFNHTFHGKCQNPETNIDPPGCPNPDCPVICGTPGSMVHFYSKLRYVAYNSTAQLMKSYVTSNSPAYQQVENSIMADSNSSKRRSLRFRRPAYDELEGHNWQHMTRRSAKSGLRDIVGQAPRVLASHCGGAPDGKLNGLPDCSWEADMKSYILTFP